MTAKEITPEERALDLAYIEMLQALIVYNAAKLKWEKAAAVAEKAKESVPVASPKEGG